MSIAVAPGPIWTPLIVATMTKESKESFGLATPLGRAGQPVEIATSFVFLASADSSYITFVLFSLSPRLMSPLLTSFRGCAVGRCSMSTVGVLSIKREGVHGRHCIEARIHCISNTHALKL